MYKEHSSALIALLPIDLSYLEAPLDLKCWPVGYQDFDIKQQVYYRIRFDCAQTDSQNEDSGF